MEGDLEQAITAVCEKLNSHKVQYLIIGGTAIGFHGHWRGTVGYMDDELKYNLDFWYKPTYRNYINLMNSLEDMKCDTSRYKDATDIKKIFLKISHSYFKTDFLPVLSGLKSFLEADNRKIKKELNGINIPILSLRDLILNKKASGRDYDLEDLLELQKMSEQKKIKKPKNKGLSLD